MKTVLIIIDSLVYLGAILSIYKFRGQLEAAFYIIMILAVILNIVCALYLYRKAQLNKTEWALFGLIGNLNAILVFWIWRYVISKWAEGEKVINSGKLED
ncbi:MAG: hypothetical protein PHV60_06600 [bacterium]|nr:hypothetical protein [bacterium]